MKLLKFQAAWCSPCKSLSNTIQEISDQIKIPVEEIDIDAQMETAIKYQVRGLPTLIVVDDAGQVIKRASGSFNTNQLLEFLNI